MKNGHGPYAGTRLFHPKVAPPVTAPGLAPGWPRLSDPEPTIAALGEYRPGCDVYMGEWDWWYADDGVYTVDPGCQYDIEIMEFEGRFLDVNSLPCIVE